ncbi:AMT [Blepharisma stoltei]|uniref:Aminomethyltransferase n=1 Tax=Blepharisma stoltei TaxID=1481888 RepID=A0AAU9ILB4_9CILI|nr:unnamed protein product [Blepharisma stoltei]
MLARRFSTAALKRTSLYDYFKDVHEAKMGVYEGYEMPAYYGRNKDTYMGEHMIIKKKAGLFDISHMGQFKIHGKQRIEFINYLTVSDLNKIPVRSCLQSLLMMPNGGIKDEITIQKFEGYIGLVVNAGCREKDFDYLFNHMQEWRSKGRDVIVEELRDQCLLSLNGPSASGIIQGQVSCSLSTTRYMQVREAKLDYVDDEPVTVMRSGHTGEDGFDISMSSEIALKWLETIVEGGLKDRFLFCGLDARDSLRLEAGKSNYCNDMDENLTPIEADLVDRIPMSKLSAGGWLGHEAVMAQRGQLERQKFEGLRLRVGFSVEKDGPSARRGAKLFGGEEGETYGVVTSGAYSPFLNKGVGMALIRRGRAPYTGHIFKAKLDKHKTVKVQIEKGPLTPHNYYD